MYFVMILTCLASKVELVYVWFIIAVDKITIKTKLM